MKKVKAQIGHKSGVAKYQSANIFQKLISTYNIKIFKLHLLVLSLSTR